ncbi:hypothetical protein I350_00367 [Cryptococcus amylolentus CBS 6273]|uniref:RINT-1 family protein n=1 Tax=Cryptococcus amylolentus CBS 6273 TaxID=1296118 RepID=A0A1E3KEZ3_9TREE|nr:hypothetical protein I350_00367 [Cryptococcus amylolentus CBS 6273]
MAHALPHQIRALALHPAPPPIAQVTAHIDTHFPDIASLAPRPPAHKRKKRAIADEIQHWENKQSRSQTQLDETTTSLPSLLESTQESLQHLLQSAQELSLQRYNLSDKLSGLVASISDVEQTGEDRQTVLGQLEALQLDLGSLEAGLTWVRLLEKAVELSESVLDSSNHKPSPLAAVSFYRELDELVYNMQSSLPSDMGLVATVIQVRDQTWEGLKEIMSQNLIAASAAIGWPRKVIYEDVPADKRRSFERAYQDLLYLQAEKEDLDADTPSRPSHWSSGDGLYPLQALVSPIEQRFKYHFMGSKGTNRVDKPEWAFANILDQIFTHQAFVATYLQPLTAQAGYEVSVSSEFTLLLLPLVLSLLKARIPHILDHPALLAHTVYQTVVFDDAVKDGGFALEDTSIYEDKEAPQWEGLTGVILRESDWFERWLIGEKNFADNRLQEIISSPDAWVISDESPDEEDAQSSLHPTVSARQTKSLIAQIIDRYTPLPDLAYRLPFFMTVQMPLLVTYHARVSSSLDAFETISSAFVRAVPGALAGNTRSGLNIDQKALTSGKAGAERLCKAYLSAEWISEALRQWSDSVFFIELSSDLQKSTALKWKVQSDPLIPQALKTPAIPASDDHVSGSIFEVIIDRYSQLSSRAEDMIVKLVTVEVENDLKQHLTRTWDNPPSTETSEPSPHLIAALTTYTSHLSALLPLLPPIASSRVYRRIVHDLSRHILQRGVYSGWSKFSEQGGRDFQSEVKEWQEATAEAFSRYEREGKVGVDIPFQLPWVKLEQVAVILSLPTSSSTEGNVPTFPQAMAAAWANDASAQAFGQRVGVQTDRTELQGLLRRRMECWKS